MTDGHHDEFAADGNPPVRTTLTDGIGRVTLSGDIDHGVAPLLTAALDELISSGARSLVVDFAQLSFFDSACISALVRAHSSVTENGGTVRLVNVNRFAIRVLEISGLVPLFDIEPSGKS